MPIPKPKKSEKKDEFVSRCMGDSVMQEYEQEQRAGICYSQWESRNKLKGNELRPIIANLNISEVHGETWKSKTYLVAPVVMAVEGVMNDIFYPESELSKRPGAWNGRPLTLFHPKDGEGNYISANDSTVNENIILGIIRNVHYDEGLKGEAWLDVEHTQSFRPEILDYWNGKKDKLEVSTGLWGDVLPVPGDHNGVSYKGIMTNLIPDHLALLPGGEGACNWQQGCGLRSNESMNKDKERLERILSNITDRELRQSIQASLDSFDVRTTTKQVSHYLEEIDLTKKQVIYEEYTRIVGPDGSSISSSDRLLRRDYKMENGGIILGDEVKEVRRVVSYQEVISNEKEKPSMNEQEKKSKVDALIACQRCRFEEKDREFLMNMTEEQLLLVTPPDNVILANERNSGGSKAGDIKSTEAGPDGKKENLSGNEKPISAIDWLNAQQDMPSEIREIISQSMLLNEQTKLELVGNLMKHPRNKFTQNDLLKKTVSELKVLTELAGSVDDKSTEQPKFFGMQLPGFQAHGTQEKNEPDPLTVVNLADACKESRKK